MKFRTANEYDGKAQPEKEPEPDVQEVPVAAPAPIPIAESDILGRLTVALEALAARQAAGPSTEIEKLLGVLTATMERVSEASLSGAKLIADETRRSHRPSNDIAPGVSVYNQRGNLTKDWVKPKLRCKMFMPYPLDDDSLTREEVELCNLLEQGDYVITRIDGSKIDVAVTVTMALDKVTPSRVALSSATGFSQENFRLIPPFAGMMRDILRQHPPAIKAKAAEVLTFDEEAALIEAGALSVSA